MATLHVLDSTGDTTLTWEASPELIAAVDEVFADGRSDAGRVADAVVAHDLALAEAKFKEMLALGYRAHMTASETDTGNDAVITRSWDEASTAAAVIMVPQTVGG